MTQINEKMVQKKGIEICTESFGNPQNPAILLIMGAGCSMVWWDTEFCQKLADKHFFVIRYDHRDTGKSTCSAAFQPNYDVLDMANDTVNILDAYQIEKAHLVGVSLGGQLAQIATIQNPERVLSLTLCGTSVWDNLPELPQIDPKIIEFYATAEQLDWEDKQALIDFKVEAWRLTNGSRHPFDEKQARQNTETEIARANDIGCMLNHMFVQGGENLYGQSKDIQAPTLIIHGTEDSTLPFAHAEMLHKTIPHSQLFTLEGAGHEIHKMDWDEVIEEIAKFIGEK